MHILRRSTCSLQYESVFPRWQYDISSSIPTGKSTGRPSERGFVSICWNAVLSQGASKCHKAEIFMPDPDAVVTERLRAEQRHSYRNTDVSGAVKHTLLSGYVRQACLITSSDSNTSDLQAAEVEKVI
jgi:hypothetical protein